MQKCPNTFIKSVNKNKSADIAIDGKGNLILHSNVDANKTILLSNVIAANDTSNNLSLRRFAESGYGIYLDDKKLEIFDKSTRQRSLAHTPNLYWVITLKIIKNPAQVDNNAFNDFSC